MRRCGLICAILLLGACVREAAPPVFAPTATGDWKLKESKSVAPAEAPEVVRKLGTRRGWSATYEGPGSATVELYELAAPAAGLEMVQQWRPVIDTAVWYTPRYFVVVKWHGADRLAVSMLIRELERQFAEAR